MLRLTESQLETLQARLRGAGKGVAAKAAKKPRHELKKWRNEEDLAIQIENVRLPLPVLELSPYQPSILQ